MNANATYQADVVLRNGSTVTLRSPRADDGAALVALSRHLASGSLYSRFSTTPRPPADEIAGMLQASPELQIVLVAESAGALVAVANCHRDDEEPDHAEVTFSVDERMQGRGLGTLLLEALARLAWARAIRTFDAYVLSGNDDMLRVFRDSGFSTTRELQAGVFHVRLELRRSAEHDARAAARSQAAATASMRAFFEPGSVAIIGANRERGKIGSEILHNVIAGGYTGRLYVVHPVASQIEGITGFPRLSAIPGAVELAVIAVPAAHVAGVVDEAIAAGVRALVVISAGFGETGAEGRAREAALVEAARRAGVRMVGPNCMGLINTHPTVRLNATFSPITPPPGRVAMSTQSGALGLAILDYARTLNIGFSTFVSVGNKADVSSNDLIQYWAEDPNTDVILLYLESFGNPRKFSQIARRTGRIKPIVAVKAGRSAVGARAASSHTGALASSDLIVDALFHQSGVIRTTTIEELFDVAALLAHQPIPRGRRVAILTNAGGPGILAADACEAQGLRLPAPTASTVGELRTFLPPAAALGNPIDMIASASAEQFGRALDVVLRDETFDAVMVIFIPPMVTRGEDVARAVQQAASHHPDKPVLGVFMSAEPAPPMLAPIPSFTFPEAAAVALAHAALYGEWRGRPEGTVPELDRVDRDAIRAIVDRVVGRGGGWTTPAESQDLLAAGGIAVASGAMAASEDETLAVADRLGYPVVVKAAGPTIVHKTELNAVRVGLAGADDVRAAWRDLKHSLGDTMTAALVQQMVSGGVEMLVGLVQDPTFGPVLACASGGTLTEVLADSQFRLHPLTDVDAREMIEGLRGVVLLRGHRGGHALDMAALEDALLRLSALVDICPEIRELDINPLTVLAEGVRALDARVRIEPPADAPASRRITY